MSDSLGEKLRSAREERGFSLSEVAEQTRISSLYLESIENDDYRILPGGIFNKGFVKSYAKFVGLSEQEALADYAKIVAQSEDGGEDPLKLYKPEVLTDDYSSRSMIPTAIVAIVMLGLMTGGLLWLVSYFRQPSAPVVTNTTNKNANSTEPANTNTETNIPGAPDMASLKVEFKTTTQPVRIQAVVDGAKSDNAMAAGSTTTFEPKESLTLNYSRWNAPVVQLVINGKNIVMPQAPADPKSQRIEFTISKDNLAQIWTSGSITGELPVATETNTVAPTQPAPKATPKPTSAANTSANTAKPANTAPASTPKPPVPTPKPPTDLR